MEIKESVAIGAQFTIRKKACHRRLPLLVNAPDFVIDQRAECRVPTLAGKKDQRIGFGRKPVYGLKVFVSLVDDFKARRHGKTEPVAVPDASGEHQAPLGFISDDR